MNGNTEFSGKFTVMGHAHLEQPKFALSWKTSALKALPGYAAEFDQRRYGAQCLDDDGQWKPIQKSTRIQTTKKAVAEAMCILQDQL